MDTIVLLCHVLNPFLTKSFDMTKSSTKEISDSLPEGVALIIYGARKVGEIDFERLVAQVKDEVKGRVGELRWALQDIYPISEAA
ncbi:MAG: hypothetical protein QW328_05125 [Nitrososphaerota archaeon]